MPTKKHAYTERLNEEFLRDHSRTDRVIANLVGCANSTAHEHRNRMITAGLVPPREIVKARVDESGRKARIEQMFLEGCSSRQTAKALGVTHRYFMQLCSDYSIRLPHKRMNRTIDPNRVVSAAANTLVGVAASLREAGDFEGIDAEQLPSWLVSISESLSTIQSKALYLRKNR